jgi:hypothetical protein
MVYRIAPEKAKAFSKEFLEEWKKSTEVFTDRFVEMYEELFKVQFDGFNKDTKYNLDHKDYLEHALTHQRKYHNRFNPERGKDILVYYTIVVNSHALQPFWRLAKAESKSF